MSQHVADNQRELANGFDSCREGRNRLRADWASRTGARARSRQPPPNNKKLHEEKAVGAWGKWGSISPHPLPRNGLVDGTFARQGKANIPAVLAKQDSRGPFSSRPPLSTDRGESRSARLAMNTTQRNGRATHAAAAILKNRNGRWGAIIAVRILPPLNAPRSNTPSSSLFGCLIPGLDLSSCDNDSRIETIATSAATNRDAHHALRLKGAHDGVDEPANGGGVTRPASRISPPLGALGDSRGDCSGTLAS